MGTVSSVSPELSIAPISGKSFSRLPVLVVYAILIGLVAATAWRGVAPADPVTSSTALDFSVERARATLTELVGDKRPHPTGTAANAAVRARIVAELSQLGYKPEVTSEFTCNPHGACAKVFNVLARFPGQFAQPYVLI